MRSSVNGRDRAMKQTTETEEWSEWQKQKRQVNGGDRSGVNS